METTACEVNNFTRPNSGNWWEVLRWGWVVFYPLSWMFTFLEFWHFLTWHEESKKTNIVSLVFLFTECVLLIKDTSILQEVCYFLIARQRESVPLCSKPQAIIQSQSEWLDWWCFLEETPSWLISPVALHFSTLSYQKRTLFYFYICVDPVLFVSPMNCCFNVFCLKWTFFPQPLHLLKLCHWLFFFFLLSNKSVYL